MSPSPLPKWPTQKQRKSSHAKGVMAMYCLAASNIRFPRHYISNFVFAGIGSVPSEMSVTATFRPFASYGRFVVSRAQAARI